MVSVNAKEAVPPKSSRGPCSNIPYDKFSTYDFALILTPLEMASYQEKNANPIWIDSGKKHA
jgi:hypothetical protein